MDNKSILNNLEILKAAIIAEPEEKINLIRFESVCGTFHCSLGLACTLPHFKALGMYLDGNKLPCIGSEWISLEGNFDPYFGEDCFENIFNSRQGCEYDKPLSDKEVAIIRLDKQIERVKAK